MIQNQLKLIPLTSIHVARDTRQRTTLTPKSVYDLALSIAYHGLLQNIGVTADKQEIVFGERRYAATQLCSKAFYSVPEDNLQLEGITPEQLSKLREAVSKNKLYENWTKIPCRLIKGTDKISHGALEFIENASREDLPWQDKAAAAYSLHKEALAACKLRNTNRPEGAPLEQWREQDSATLLGLSTAYFQTLTSSLRELESAGEKSSAQIKDAIKNSSSALAAKNAAKTIKERHSEPTSKKNKLQGKILKPNKAAPEHKPEPEPEPIAVPILNVDFHEWAANYSGPAFNFIHCDFPYGIGYNTGSNFNANQATVQQGKYDDSTQVYWELLSTLSKNKKRLIAPQAHIMFWFSQNLYLETLEYLIKHFPEAVIQKHMMIWVQQTKHTTPDSLRYGQRNYQTALLLTFGDRKIVQPRRLAFVHDGQKKIHRSQKPHAVLSHFFEMFVDGSTQMLDPTCGSATSLIAANKLGASRVLGLEIDPTMHEQAVKHWSSHV